VGSRGGEGAAAEEEHEAGGRPDGRSEGTEEQDEVEGRC
jgi:hypothetical protein